MGVFYVRACVCVSYETTHIIHALAQSKEFCPTEQGSAASHNSLRRARVYACLFDDSYHCSSIKPVYFSSISCSLRRKKETNKIHAGLISV